MLQNDKKAKDLMEGARRLDINSLNQLHDLYYEDVYRYIYFRIMEEALCANLATQVFLRLLDALKRRRVRKINLEVWLFDTAARLVDEQQKHGAQKLQPVKNSDASSDKQDNNLADKQRLRIYRAISSLPPQEQHVLALRFTSAHSLDEISTLTGVRATKIKTLQYKALGEIRQELDKS